MNVDASFYADTLQKGAGFVLRNSDGNLIMAQTMLRDGLMRVDEGEAWGTFEAAKWAAEMGVGNVVIETDAQVVRDAYNSEEIAVSIFGDYISAGKLLLRDNNDYAVKWVCRNANALAHAFARAARNYGSSHSWDEPPMFVEGLLDWCTMCM